jgi:hypothetical protein
MMGVLTITASAAAIGVNVPPGYVIEVDSQFTPGMSEICPSFIAGLSDKVAVGVMYDTYVKNVTIIGQAEYYFSEHWMGNAGLMYSGSTMSSSTSIILGAGFGVGYLEFGVNYIAPTNDFSNPVIGVAVDYLIKK